MNDIRRNVRHMKYHQIKIGGWLTLAAEHLWAVVLKNASCKLKSTTLIGIEKQIK